MLHAPGPPRRPPRRGRAGAGATTTGGPACWRRRPRPTASWSRRATARRAEGLRDVLVDQGRYAEAIEIQRGGRCEPGRPAARAPAGGPEPGAAAPRTSPAAPGGGRGRRRPSTRRERRRAARPGRGRGERRATPGAALAAGRGARRRAGGGAPRLAGAPRRCAGGALALAPIARWRAPGRPPPAALRGRAPGGGGGEQPRRWAAPARARRATLTGEVTLASANSCARRSSPSGPEELAGRHDLLVAALLRRVRPLLCGRCGAEAAVRSWRCRRCGTFDSFVPQAAA